LCTQQPATSLRPQRLSPSLQSHDRSLDHFNIILQLSLDLQSNFLPDAFQNTFSLCKYVEVKLSLHHTRARAPARMRELYSPCYMNLETVPT